LQFGWSTPINIFVPKKKEFILSKQLLRSGTSIGANIAEANGAISKAEFSAKMSIADRECLKTQYWLCLLRDTGYITSEAFDSVYADAEALSKCCTPLSNRVGK